MRTYILEKRLECHAIDQDACQWYKRGEGLLLVMKISSMFRFAELDAHGWNGLCAAATIDGIAWP